MVNVYCNFVQTREEKINICIISKKNEEKSLLMANFWLQINLKQICESFTIVDDARHMFNLCCRGKMIYDLVRYIFEMLKIHRKFLLWDLNSSQNNDTAKKNIQKHLASNCYYMYQPLTPLQLEQSFVVKCKKNIINYCSMLVTKNREKTFVYMYERDRKVICV